MLVGGGFEALINQPLTKFQLLNFNWRLKAKPMINDKSKDNWVTGLRKKVSSRQELKDKRLSLWNPQLSLVENAKVLGMAKNTTFYFAQSNNLKYTKWDVKRNERLFK